MIALPREVDVSKEDLMLFGFIFQHDPDPTAISEYERKRIENIRKNNELLAELNIVQVKYLTVKTIRTFDLNLKLTPYETYEVVTHIPLF